MTFNTTIKTIKAYLIRYSWAIDFFLLTLVIGTCFVLFLGSHPLGVPDEARYAEIPREMVATGNYLTPHLNYVKYFEKPPLFYWMQASAIKLAGLSEWTLRAPNALMALFGCLLIYGVGRKLYDRRTGVAASIILATNLLYFAMAHIVTLDMTFTVLSSASLFFFLLGTQNNTQHKRSCFYSAYAFAALAVLAKGLVGLLFPLLIVGAWLALINEWRVLRHIYLGTGLVLFLVISLPWHILVQIKNPEFFHFYFIEQHFLRYLTKWTGRYKPDWFFIPVLLGGFFPWIIFLFQAIAEHLPKSWASRQQNKKELFLLLWPLLIFIFFSFSDSKLVPYLLPIFPPLALLTAHYLTKTWDTTTSVNMKRYYSGLLVFIALTTGGLVFVSQHKFAHIDFSNARSTLGYLAVFWTIGAGIATWCAEYKKNRAAFFVTAGSTAFALCLILSGVSQIDIGSIKPLVLTLQPLLKPNDQVVSYEHYYQDLPYYLQRRVTVVDWHGELTFGMQHQDTSAWMITNQQFLILWKSPQRIYAFADEKGYRHLLALMPDSLYIIAQQGKNILITNHKTDVLSAKP